MYISSNDNRLYAVLETEYGKAGSIAATNRFPAGRLSVKQSLEKVQRRDKTGTRSFVGLPTGVRRQTTFELKTPMCGAQGGSEPGYSALFEAVMGAALRYAGGTVADVPTAGRIQFSGAHGLTPGQAVAIGTEIRFAAAIVDSQTVELNAPFTVPVAAGASVLPSTTYCPSKMLPSVTMFDYWSPAESVQRMVTGGAVNELSIAVNGDWHEFEFRGQARDVIDSASFEQGQAGLDEYPIEPALGTFEHSIVPGHLGQVWMGASPERFLTLIDAELKIHNGIDLRAREFGTDGPTLIVPGERKVTASMELFASDDAQTQALYQSARQRSPLQVMFQLGQQAGQMFGAYMKSVIPEVPDFNDAHPRLSWKFAASRAQGTIEDEITIAFA